MTEETSTNSSIWMAIILAVVGYYAVKKLLFPEMHYTSVEASQEVEEPVVMGTFTPSQLSKFNGVDDPKILIAVKGKVYDVTPGKHFYGPSGPYANFAGRDASRGLAKNSFDEAMLTPLGKPLDKLEDLEPFEVDSLNNWAASFDGKYTCVGTLIEEENL